MGNSSSTSEREEIGDRIFLYAKTYLHDKVVDDSKLEGITGIILDSCSDLDELRFLLTNDTKELERRITKSSLILEVESEKASCMKKFLPNKNENDKNNDEKAEMMNRTRQELISHFERLDPSLDSARIADELLSLPETELSYVISDQKRFKHFMENCLARTNDLIDAKAQGVIASNIESMKLPKKLKIGEKELGSELSNEDVDALIGNQLFERVSKFHPSKAELITGVLMGHEKDVVLHLLASTSLLHKNIALVISELEKKGKVTQSDIITLQEELGDVLYALLEKEIDADKASHVTGMLLEMNVAEVHEVLSDEKVFRSRLKAAINTLQKK